MLSILKSKTRTIARPRSLLSHYFIQSIIKQSGPDELQVSSRRHLYQEVPAVCSSSDDFSEVAVEVVDRPFTMDIMGNKDEMQEVEEELDEDEMPS